MLTQPSVDPAALSSVLRNRRASCLGKAVYDSAARRKHVSSRGYTLTMVHELRNDDDGRYLVTTATGSQYVLDLTARTVQRVMAATAPLTEYLDVGFSRLRRDGESLELLMLESCTVGSPARYWLQIRADHVVTLRTTSPVVDIVALDPLDGRGVA